MEPEAVADRILKSSTVFIRNEQGRIDYIFAINFDVTELQIERIPLFEENT